MDGSETERKSTTDYGYSGKCLEIELFCGSESLYSTEGAERVFSSGIYMVFSRFANCASSIFSQFSYTFCIAIKTARVMHYFSFSYFFMQLIPELQLEDETSYFNYFRMDKKHFGLLSDRIKSLIRKCDKEMRVSIKPEECLAVTLRYLATGESFKSLEFQCRISRTAISNIVEETCKAIFNVLSKELLKLPSTSEGW